MSQRASLFVNQTHFTFTLASQILMIVALLLYVCPCTPVEEGGYGPAASSVDQALDFLLMWSDFHLHGVLLMNVSIVCDNHDLV